MRVVQTEGIMNSSINDIGFVVTDNGIGFDENNMKSFLQSDLRIELKKGCWKIAWLKSI